MLIKRIPDAVSPRAIEFKVGNAMSRTPSCSGTTKFIIPITNGIAMKKIMIVPCAEKIWSKCSGGKYPCAPPAATACCARIMMASAKPRSSMISASMMYMMPMRLWSTEVSHSRQR